MNKTKGADKMQVIQRSSDIIICNVKDFDVSQTLECGQCFHFKKLGENEYGIAAFGRLLHVKQMGTEVIFYHVTMDEYENIWKYYFDLETDYSEIKTFLLKKDDKLKAAIETMSGVRILRQEFFETLISFIISQNKQIAHIKKIVETISSTYGIYLGEINGERFYSFPDSTALGKITLEELKACKTGFRAPYIVDAIEKVNNGTVSVDRLKNEQLTECESSLTQIKGVGVKVANCVMLFGLHKIQAFPIDVWIKRIMEYLYFHKEVTSGEIAEFARTRYGKYGGYAQQYLFYYGRETKMGANTKKEKSEVKVSK